MTIQTANIGASPNDGTGTPLRDAVDLFNQNFIQLSTNSVVNTSITVGNTATGNVFVNSSLIYVQNNAAYVRIGNSASVNVIANSSVIQTAGLVNTGTLSVTSNTLNLGTTSSAGANGYTYLPNGLKMNWGWVYCNSTIGNAIFTSAYTTECYVVTVTGNTANASFAPFVPEQNTTAAVIRTNDNTAINVHFIALGK